MIFSLRGFVTMSLLSLSFCTASPRGTRSVSFRTLRLQGVTVRFCRISLFHRSSCGRLLSALLLTALPCSSRTQ